MNVRFFAVFFFFLPLSSRVATHYRLSGLCGAPPHDNNRSPPRASALKRKNLESITKWELEIAAETSCAGFVKLLQCDNQRTLALSPSPSMTARPIVARELRKRCRRQMQSSKLRTYTQSLWPQESLTQLQNSMSAVLLNIAIESQQHAKEIPARQISRDVPAWML